MPVPLEGKVAVVTGSSRGIGKAIALALAADGCDVVVAARTQEQQGDIPGTIGETVAAVEGLGRRALGVRCDVTRDEDLAALVERAYSEFGRVDILVNNAGGGTGGSFLEAGVSALDHTYRINVRAPYVLTQLVARPMAEAGGGGIVNISSGAARNPPPPTPENAGSAPQFGAGLAVTYGMMKAALDRFGAGIARELWDKNIAVININPGFTITERLAMRMPPEQQARGERPETTGKAVAFLCREPMRHTGGWFTARTVVDENRL